MLWLLGLTCGPFEKTHKNTQNSSSQTKTLGSPDKEQCQINPEGSLSNKGENRLGKMRSKNKDFQTRLATVLIILDTAGMCRDEHDGC